MSVLIRPTPLEIASAIMFGEHAGAEPLPTPLPDQTPRQALELSVLDSLRRPPCVVSFSGGRDSSAVLAVAALVARREELPLPVPATLRYPDPRDEIERRYQDKVVSLLGIEDWHIVHAGPELEILGPEATGALRRHGVLVPRHRHLHLPLLRMARGGSLMTGFDGNGVFGKWRFARAWDVMTARARPRLRDIGRVALAAAPEPVRRQRLARSYRAGRMPWISPATERLLVSRYVTEQAKQPAHWARWVEWYARRRALAAVGATLEVLGEDEGVVVRHPLVDARFLAALAQAGHRSGLGDRDGMMRRLFGDLLPDDVLTRSFEPAYASTLWGERTREFVESWNGEGVDPELVDPDALRAAWRSCDDATALLLQAAWLKAAGDRATEAA